MKRIKELNLTGQRFGMLLALRPTDKRQNNRIVWECRCDCGNITYVPTNYLTTGDTRSCGCLKDKQDEINLREKYDEKKVDGVAMHLFDDQPRKDSSTGYRGVYQYKTRVSKAQRYGAWITVKGKKYYKTGFKTPEEAYYQGRLMLEEKHLPNKEDTND